MRRADLRTMVAMALVVAALALSGCADGEGAYVTSTSSHFTAGVTTRTQAIADLGPPSSVYDLADGSRTLTWARSGGLFAESETRSLSVLFGPDDKMVRVVPTAAPAQ
jgi:hypothetical protein